MLLALKRKLSYDKAILDRIWVHITIKEWGGGGENGQKSTVYGIFIYYFDELENREKY